MTAMQMAIVNPIMAIIANTKIKTPTNVKHDFLVHTKLKYANAHNRVSLRLFRGVQYVHWVMHKCIMVKVEGETK